MIYIYDIHIYISIYIYIHIYVDLPYLKNGHMDFFRSYRLLDKLDWKHCMGWPHGLYRVPICLFIYTDIHTSIDRDIYIYIYIYIYSDTARKRHL